MNDTAADLVERGLALHRGGAIEEAAALYAEARRRDPANADASYYLAVIACRQGRFEDGIALAREALTVGSGHGRTHNLMGMALHRLGRREEALAQFDAAVASEPQLAEAHGNRGLVLDEMGRAADALASLDRAIALEPNMAKAQFNRAMVLLNGNRVADALAGFERVIALDPGFAEAHAQRGVALRLLDRYAEALASHDRAVALRPNDAGLTVSRAHALRKLGRLADAEAEYERALAINPSLAAAYLGRAHLMLELGRYRDARDAVERAHELDPDAPEHPNTRAYLNLLFGDWEQGWKDYEFRNRTRNPAYFPLPYRRWNGGPPTDERLVLLVEQGMGDAIHFCRFAPMLAERGYDVTILTERPLARLLSSLAGVRIATTTDELERDGRPLCWAPLMSVPGILGVRPSSIPARVPYLAAEPALVEAWRQRIGNAGFKIGLCWKSGPQAERISRGRDVPLAAWAPLADIPGVRLIALQIGPGLDEIAAVPFRDRIERFDDSIRDWADTAAVMTNVDLVVTCDTSVPHLAGALARPTLLALPAVACWRWQLDREDSPWYPTLRLFRKSIDGDWSNVVTRIAEAVRHRLQPS